MQNQMTSSILWEIDDTYYRSKYSKSKKKSSLTPKICNSILGPRMLPEHIIEGVICIIECVGIVMAIGGSVLQSE